MQWEWIEEARSRALMGSRLTIQTAAALARQGWEGMVLIDPVGLIGAHGLWGQQRFQL